MVMATQSDADKNVIFAPQNTEIQNKHWICSIFCISFCYQGKHLKGILIILIFFTGSERAPCKKLVLVVLSFNIYIFQILNVLILFLY